MAILFTKLLACSVGMGLFIALMVVTSARWSRLFAAKWSVRLWAILAACLCVPLAPSIPAVEAFFTRYAWIPACWLIVGLLVLAYGFLCQQRFRAQALKWSAEPENQNYSRKAEKLAQELNMARGPVIRVTAKVACPTILGLGNPVLLLPHESYSDAEFDILIRHEFYHYLHGHIPYKLFMRAVNALHWFNPAVWLMRQRAEIDLEEACDDALLVDASEKTRRQYSETILSVMQSPSGCTAPFSTHTYGSPTATGKRLARLLSAPPKTGGLALLCAAVILSFLSGTAVATATARLEAPASGVIVTERPGAVQVPQSEPTSSMQAVSQPNEVAPAPNPADETVPGGEPSGDEPESSLPAESSQDASGEEAQAPSSEDAPEPESSEPAPDTEPEPEGEPQTDDALAPDFPVDAAKEMIETLPDTIDLLNGYMDTLFAGSSSLEGIAVPGEKSPGMPSDEVLMVVINRVVDAYNNDTADTSMSDPDAPRLMPLPSAISELPKVEASEDFTALPRTSNGYSIVVPVAQTGMQMQIWVDDNGGDTYLFDIVAVNFVRG